jgi:hypothetical protein
MKWFVTASLFLIAATAAFQTPRAFAEYDDEDQIERDIAQDTANEEKAADQATLMPYTQEDQNLDESVQAVLGDD